MLKDYFYTSYDGNHFPDAPKGSNLYYSIDITSWLNVENDSLVSVEWSFPKQITSEENFLVGMEATIKLLTNYSGTFRITCKITSVENGKEQVVAVPMMLTVI